MLVLMIFMFGPVLLVQAQVEVPSETGTVPETVTKTETVAGSDTGAVTKTETVAGSETGAVTKTKTVAGSETGAVTKTETVPVPKIEVMPVPKIEVMPVPKIEVMPVPKTEVTPVPKTEAIPVPETKADAENSDTKSNQDNEYSDVENSACGISNYISCLKTCIPTNMCHIRECFTEKCELDLEKIISMEGIMNGKLPGYFGNAVNMFTKSMQIAKNAFSLFSVMYRFQAKELQYNKYVQEESNSPIGSCSHHYDGYENDYDTHGCDSDYDIDTNGYDKDYDINEYDNDYDTNRFDSDYDTNRFDSDYDINEYDNDYDTNGHDNEYNDGDFDVSNDVYDTDYDESNSYKDDSIGGDYRGNKDNGADDNYRDAENHDKHSVYWYGSENDIGDNGDDKKFNGGSKDKDSNGDGNGITGVENDINGVKESNANNRDDSDSIKSDDNKGISHDKKFNEYGNIVTSFLRDKQLLPFDKGQLQNVPSGFKDTTFPDKQLLGTARESTLNPPSIPIASEPPQKFPLIFPQGAQFPPSVLSPDIHKDIYGEKQNNKISELIASFPPPPSAVQKPLVIFPNQLPNRNLPLAATNQQFNPVTNGVGQQVVVPANSHNAGALKNGLSNPPKLAPASNNHAEAASFSGAYVPNVQYHDPLPHPTAVNPPVPGAYSKK